MKPPERFPLIAVLNDSKACRDASLRYATLSMTHRRALRPPDLVILSAAKYLIPKTPYRTSLMNDVGRLYHYLKTPAPLSQACKLTKYATTTRYPGDAGPVTAQEYAEAIAIAEAVVRWAEERIL